MHELYSQVAQQEFLFTIIIVQDHVSCSQTLIALQWSAYGWILRQSSETDDTASRSLGRGREATGADGLR